MNGLTVLFVFQDGEAVIDDILGAFLSCRNGEDVVDGGRFCLDGNESLTVDLVQIREDRAARSRGRFLRRVGVWSPSFRAGGARFRHCRRIYSVEDGKCEN